MTGLVCGHAHKTYTSLTQTYTHPHTHRLPGNTKAFIFCLTGYREADNKLRHTPKRNCALLLKGKNTWISWRLIGESAEGVTKPSVEIV